MVGLALLVWRVQFYLLLIVVGVLLGVFLRALTRALHRHTPLSEGLSLPAVVLGLLVLLGLTAWWLLPPLVAQSSQFAQTVPHLADQVHDYLGQYGWGTLLLDQIPSAEEATAQIDLLTVAEGTLAEIASVLTAGLFTLLIGLFLAASPATYRRGLVRLAPPPHRARAAEVAGKAVITLERWMLGQLFSMLVIGAFTALGLWIIGMPFVLTLGALAGLLEIVPYLGPVLSAVPALLLAALQGPEQIAYVAGLYLLVHLIEGYLLMPVVQKYTVSLPPALTLCATVIGGVLFGIIGVFVATPVVAVALVLVKMLYLEDALGDAIALPERRLEKS